MTDERRELSEAREACERLTNAALVAARSAGSGSRVEREYDEAVESVHRAFCFPDHEQVGEWDRSMADALRRRGYAIVNLNAADCPTPPPAVDGTRCIWEFRDNEGPCDGGPGSILHRHLSRGPCPYEHPSDECHPFTPPAPDPDRLRALEEADDALRTFLTLSALLVSVIDSGEVLSDHDRATIRAARGKARAARRSLAAARDLLADGERSDG